MVLDSALLSTQHYKVRIKGKIEQSYEQNCALPYTLMQQLLKREPLLYLLFLFRHGIALDCKEKAFNSSSSCRAASTDIPDPLSPRLPIIHRLWQVFGVTSRIITQLLYVCSSWSGEEAKRQSYKNVKSNIEHLLAATPHKAPTIRSPTTYHENYPSKTNQTCRTLLEKQGRARKGCTPVDPRICRLIIKESFCSFNIIETIAILNCVQTNWF